MYGLIREYNIASTTILSEYLQYLVFLFFKTPSARVMWLYLKVRFQNNFLPLLLNEVWSTRQRNRTKSTETTKQDAIKPCSFKTSLEGKDKLVIIINKTTSVQIKHKDIAAFQAVKGYTGLCTCSFQFYLYLIPACL